MLLSSWVYVQIKLYLVYLPSYNLHLGVEDVL